MQDEDQWRRRLNRAVRDFAAGIETGPLESAMRGLLQEVGDALQVPRAAFVSVQATPGGTLVHYEWSSTPAPFTAPWIEAPSLRAPLADTSGEPRVVSLEDSGEAIAMVVPTGTGWNPAWRWVLATTDPQYTWSEPLIDHLQILGDVVAALLERHRRPTSHAEQDAPALRRPAPRRAGASGGHRFDAIIGQSPALLTALSTLEEVIDTNATVLLLGETGTGKELFARALHRGGPRRAFPLVSVNCGALPPSLIESELFGHQRGAFTGAVAPRQGRFELAHRGTLFLDEIGDLALELQAKLLRVLQEGAFERVGSSQTQVVDVRIVAATHHDLERAVTEGRFRADLFYRLNVFPIRVPTLRERREDIPALVWHIIEQRQARFHRHITHIPQDVWDALQQYSWPGNIRELENVIEAALIHSTSHALTLRENSLISSSAPHEADSRLTAVDRIHIERVLRECDWRINGAGNAAERLGLHPNTLRFRIKKLGIVRDPTRAARPLPFASEGRDRVS